VTRTCDLGRGGRTGRVVAGVTVVYGVAALLLAIHLDRSIRLSDVDHEQLTGAGGASLWAWGASALVGATLLVRRPANPVGWLFSALGFTLATWGLSESYGVYGLSARNGSLPGSAEAAVIANSIFILAFVLIALVCSLTPDGRYSSSRWRMSSHVMVGTGSAWLVLRLISPAPLEPPFTSIVNPWAVTAFDPRPVRLITAIVTTLLVATSVVSLVDRFVRARGEVRRQMLWLVVAAVPMPILLAVAFTAAVTNNELLLNASTAALIVVVPVGAGLAVGRFQLYDVDRILSRAVTYVVVAGCLLATYAAVVIVVASAVGQAAGQSPIATTSATLAAAAIARPIYGWVRDELDRRFQRRRYDAVRQVRKFIADPQPERGVEAVLRDALNDTCLRVAYWDEAGSRWVSENGHTTDFVTADAVLVERSGRPVAAVASSYDDGTTIRAVLDEAAPELDNARLRASIAVQIEEIRASRERIAHAQIDERRRIERDLHDGAQQRLLGVAAQMQAALLNGTSERLAAALELGVRECRNTVADLRSLANGLHPAVLEDGGLGAALDDLSLRLPVSVSMTGAQRRYQPLIEATLWFVACEAVTNAVKHASSDNVTVHLDDLDDELRLVVRDDGPGGANPAGAGLRGLTDRVEAAGGRLTIASSIGAGTTIEAVLPCTS
jgi:signal transduction histidine kinase